jgi:hypothetical protein
MDNVEVVVLEFLMPSRSSSGQLPGGLPVREVLVVRLNHKGFLGPDKVGPLVFYHLNYSEELKVVGVIVLFGGRERG